MKNYSLPQVSNKNMISLLTLGKFIARLFCHRSWSYMKTLEQSSHFSQNMVDLLNVRPFNALIMYQIMGHKRKEMITNMRQNLYQGNQIVIYSGKHLAFGNYTLAKWQVQTFICLTLKSSKLSFCRLAQKVVNIGHPLRRVSTLVIGGWGISTLGICAGWKFVTTKATNPHFMTTFKSTQK